MFLFKPAFIRMNHRKGEQSMKRFYALLLSILLLSCGCVSAEVAGTADETWNLIRQAYIYSFPLVLMDATLTVGTNTEEPAAGKAPINQVGHAKNLATAAFTQVVTPNVDTLYSQIFYDLSGDALVIQKPAADRYLTFQIMDAWSDTVAMIGTGADTQDERTYLLTGPGFSGEVPEGMTRISIPTNMGWIIGRTICYGPEDLENVHAVQEKMNVRALSLWKSGEEQPKGKYDPANDGVPFQMAIGMGPKAFFDRVNELLVLNPAYPEDAAVLEKISAVGVGPGLTFDPSILGDDAAERWKTMLSGLTNELTVSSARFLVNNGSFRFMGEPISRFGQEYDYRALVAIGGFGANPVDAAIYMKSGFDDAGEALNAKNAYVLHFEKDALPPVKENGFWSITAYGDDDFLIDNPLNRYAITDRSDFTKNPDGSVDLLLQTEEPKENPQNWLPVGEGGFHLFMRIYLPQDSVQNGTWKAPSLKKQ